MVYIPLVYARFCDFSSSGTDSLTLLPSVAHVSVVGDPGDLEVSRIIPYQCYAIFAIEMRTGDNRSLFSVLLPISENEYSQLL